MAEPTPSPTPAPEPTPTPNQEQGFTQDDIDKAVKEAESRWNSELADKLAKAKSEGEKLAKMTAEQRRTEEERQAREEFEREKAEFEHKSLVAEVKSQLADKGLPVAFADMIAGDSAETSKTAIESFETEWNKALEAAVEKKLSGKTPNVGVAEPKGSGNFFDIIKENQRI